MAGSAKHELEFFLLRYVPEALTDEFVNVGVVLLGNGADAGYAEVRFTRDWRRVLCLDPGVDVEWLQALERDIRRELKDAGSRENTLYRLQDLCSSAIQISATKGCMGAEPTEEIETLAKMYLEGAPQQRVGERALGERQRIVTAMRSAFEGAGVWGLMQRNIPAKMYTHEGDPLKIDCAYRAPRKNDPTIEVVNMFQAVALRGGVDTAKALAFSYPALAKGIERTEKAAAALTAVVEDGLDRSSEAILFALATMARSGIRVAAVSEMPGYAEEARVELRV